MVMTTPVSRKRCPLCLAMLEISHVHQGEVIKAQFSELHTAERCAQSTLARIKALEELHHRDVHQLDDLSATVGELGSWLGPCSMIVSVGRRWLELRAKRAADLERLRNAFGTADRANHNPLWAAESEVAEAVQFAISAAEKRGRV